jgi:hypothetical protein
MPQPFNNVAVSNKNKKCNFFIMAFLASKDSFL